MYSVRLSESAFGLLLTGSVLGVLDETLVLGGDLETGDALEVLGVLGLEVVESSVVLGDNGGGKGEDSESELHYCLWVVVVVFVSD